MKKYLKYIVICFLMFFCFNSDVNAYLECEFGDPDFGDVYFSFYVDQNGTPHYNNTHDNTVYYFEGSGYSYNRCPETVYVNGDENFTYIYLNKNACSIKFGYCYNYTKMSSKEVEEGSSGDEYEEGKKVPSDSGEEQKPVVPPGGGKSIFTGSCPSNSGLVSIIRALYQILKMAAPIALVIYGTLDFAKAVIASDEGQMKKAQSAFVRRILAAIVVILIMSLVSLLSSLIPSESGVFSCVENILK